MVSDDLACLLDPRKLPWAKRAAAARVEVALAESEGLYAATANHLRHSQAENEQLRRLLRWSLDYIGIDWDESYPDEPPAVTEARSVLTTVEGAVT